MFQPLTAWRGVVCAAAILSAQAAGAASYNEFVDGDLSNNVLAPTAWALGPGANQLVAQSSAADPDLLRISVPADYAMDSVLIEFHEDHANPVFVGMQSGSQWTAGVGAEIDLSKTLGWVNFPTNPQGSHVGEDILADIGLGAGAIGFAPPLPSGIYTLLFQTPSTAIPFALNFNVLADLAGDFDGNGFVGDNDYAWWRDSFAIEGSTDADADLDGDSDGDDFLIWQKNYSRSAGMTPTSTVPEPGAALWVAAAWGGLAAKRRWTSNSHAGERG